jgi:hypothetical protein
VTREPGIIDICCWLGTPSGWCALAMVLVIVLIALWIGRR